MLRQLATALSGTTVRLGTASLTGVTSLFACSLAFTSVRGFQPLFGCKLEFMSALTPYFPSNTISTNVYTKLFVANQNNASDLRSHTLVLAGEEKT